MSVYNQSRKNIILLIFVAIFGVIALRLFYLQIIEKKYRLLATAQAVQRKVIYPTRGIIYDRNGKAVVNNDALYDLTVIPNEVKKIDTAYFCELLGIDTADFRKRMHRAVVRNGWVRPSVFAPLLPQEIYGRLQENIYQFPGFDLVERPVRHYPFHGGGNIWGLIGEADSSIIKRSNYFYQAGDFVGITGLERTYEPVLMGQRGIHYVVRDVHNRIMGSYEKGKYDTTAIAGKNLRLALDIDLQVFGEKLMQNKIGSIVAIDPKTGGILAMVSSPGFDPNVLTGSSRGENYVKLLRDPAKPLFNRAIQAMYPPGSTFKPLDALVALDEGVITPSFGINCVGYYYGCGRVLHCTEHWAGHSKDLETAIAYSCNSYFFDVFRKIIDHTRNVENGLVEWKKYMNSFGLGHRLGLDIPGESSGYIPDTSHYDKIFGRGHWNSCTIVSCGIGQGEVLETPLQIANGVCLIANHGYYYTPHFVNSIDGDTALLSPFHKKHVVTRIPDTMYRIVVAGMAQVMEHGTGAAVSIPGIPMCGKTGTAQNPHGKDHSLFEAFAPRDNPRIAIAVVVENAGYGATYAAPIASLMIEKYLRDTIAAGPRTALMKRMMDASVLPEYLMNEMKKLKEKQDSTQKSAIKINNSRSLRRQVYASTRVHERP
jgi:penicillin-binding protein 2